MTDIQNVADDEAQIIADEQEEAQEQKQETKEDRRPSSVAKLLKQRNEAREELQEFKGKFQDVEKLTKKVSELEEMYAKSVLETESKVQKTEFFTKNPHAKELETDIEAIRAKKDLSYDEAFKLVAADKNPSLLMDEQYRNKATSTTNLTGVAKDNTIDKGNPTLDDLKSMSDDDVLRWMDSQAKKERISGGKLR